VYNGGIYQGVQGVYTGYMPPCVCIPGYMPPYHAHTVHTRVYTTLYHPGYTLSTLACWCTPLHRPAVRRWGPGL